jgi:hypothetical protein
MAFLEALFWFGIAALGVGPFFIFPEGKVKRTYGITLTVLGILACAYSVYRHYYSETLPQFPFWIIIWVLTWVLLGYDIYLRRSRPSTETTEISAEWRDGFTKPRFEIIDDRRFENEEIVVDNKSFRRCSFKNVKLLFHGIAPFEFVEGTTLDAGNVIFATDDPAILTFNAIQRKFASIPGAKIEHGALDSKGKAVLISPVTVEPVGPLAKPLQYPIPALRLKVFEICSALQGFLGTYGEEPKAERQLPESQEDFMKRFREAVPPWRARVNGNFRLTFGESIPRLRDEISARAGMNMSFLDIAINGAMTNVNQPTEAINKLLKTLEEMAWEINA